MNERAALRASWARLTNFMTVVAVLFAPSLYFYTTKSLGAPWWWGLISAIAGVGVVRGGMDLIARKVLPWPTLFDAEKPEQAKQQDALARKRFNFWKGKYGLAWKIILGITFWTIAQKALGHDSTWIGTATSAWDAAMGALTNGQMLQQLIILPMFFLANMVLFMGPMLAMGISQIKLYEPGDVDFDVKLEDVRGQAEAKSEITKIVTLWESGEDFVMSGGKRERGILFLGPPGVGKTMLAKAIATSFNAPIVTIPGSGFAQTFIGMDVLVVRFLTYKAKKAARKWGGQCIVFIDEIDAVGMRRQGVGGGGLGGAGGMGMFAGGGQLALNSLLVAMDSLDSPPFMKRTFRSKVNTYLDALYIVPRNIGRLALRLPKARSTGAEIHWIGATNVALELLDPALVRPGRMGRHVYFRMPTKEDRRDIFDLYLGKVKHVEALDTPEARDELARMTHGYSPAAIEQACSMALTTAHHDGRHVFDRDDILNAMTSVESGTAVNIEYNEKETKAVAIHEAGHACVAHMYMDDEVNTRLSIRMRGNSLGHNAAQAKDEHFLSFRDAEVGKLLWGLGAMAAELVFFEQNSTGVGGDIQQTTQQANYMVGMCAMGPDPISGSIMSSGDEEIDDYNERKLQALGYQLLAFAPEAMTVGGPKSKLVAQLLGQAFITAYVFIKKNQYQVETVADELVNEREIFGDDLVALLDRQHLTKWKFSDIHLGDSETWPPNAPTVKFREGGPGAR